MLLCIPGIVVILVTLWFSRDAAIKDNEKHISKIAKNLSTQQKAMINDVERLTLFLSKKHINLENLSSRCPEYFTNFHTLYDTVANMSIYNAQGNIICATKGQNTNINISDRHYYQNAINNKKFSISYFQFGRSIKTPSIVFASPILDNAKQVKGLLVTSIALHWWSSALTNLNLPPHAQAAITDTHGLVLANYPHILEQLGTNITSTALLHNPKHATIYKGSDGIKRLFHQSTLYSDENNNTLEIFIALPINESIEQIDINFVKMVIVFFMLTIVLAILTKQRVNKSILTPIENLTAAINSLATGNMPTHKTQPNSPELNTLYQRFKYMAETRLTAEANLKHKHDELTSLLNALPDTFLRINRNAHILNIGGNTELLSNNNAAQPKNLACLLTPNNLDCVKMHLKDLAAPIIVELEKQDENHLEIQISPMAKKDEFILVLRNITQRKHNEKSLHLASLVYQNSSEGMAITDENGIIYDVNPAFCKTTLFSKEEVIGKTTSILSSGKHSAAFYNKMWEDLNTTGRWQGEITNRRKNGELYIEWLTIDTIYDKQRTALRRIAIFTDLTEKKQADELIWRQAHFDHLTDLPNRLELKERLTARFKTLTTNQQQLTVMLLDIDHFKDINDTLGHHYGDSLLKLVAKRIVVSASDADFVARIGGDEFVVVFNNIHTNDEIKSTAKNLLLSLASAFFIDNEKLYISASIGIARAPNDGQTPEQLLKAADQAMYQTKNNGRNGFEFFSHDMRKHAHARMQLLKELRLAIEQQQFELFYQPIVALKNLHIHKAEGLIRWQHPEKGIISPADFIPLAEETRQINALGQFVFAQALQTLNDIKTITNDEFQISINVSPVQLATVDSGIDDWFNMLKEANLPASAIVAEITEGLMVNPEELTQNRLKTLVKSGMQLALDDFGTGYSSLAYLQEMDTDYLKIDKRFVDNINEGSQELALCEAIIMMAHQLGLQVIAEGIETPLQMELLLKAGCDYGQGYLFSKPLCKHDFMSLLANR